MWKEQLVSSPFDFFLMFHSFSCFTSFECLDAACQIAHVVVAILIVHIVVFSALPSSLFQPQIATQFRDYQLSYEDELVQNEYLAFDIEKKNIIHN